LEGGDLGVIMEDTYVSELLFLEGGGSGGEQWKISRVNFHTWIDGDLGGVWKIQFVSELLYPEGSGPLRSDGGYPVSE
jgi:hypothetical protein